MHVRFVRDILMVGLTVVVSTATANLPRNPTEGIDTRPPGLRGGTMNINPNPVCNSEKNDPYDVQGGRMVCNERGSWEFEAKNVPVPQPRPTNLSAPASTRSQQPTRTNPSGRTSNARGGNEKFERCKASGSAVATSCSTSAVNSNAGSFTNGSSQTGQQISAQQQNQTADMCRQAGQNAQEAGGTIDTIISQCQGAMSACTSACSEVTESGLSQQQKNELAQARSQCSSGNSALQTLQSQKSQVQQNQQRAQQCLNDVGQGGSLNEPTNKEVNCTATPNAPGCLQAKQDCSNPEFAATNEVCRCASGNCGEQKHAASATDEGADTSAVSEDASPTPDMNASLDGSPGAGYESSYADANLQGGGAGGGGSGGGSNSGANTPGVKASRDHSKINANTLAGLVAAKGAGKFGSGSQEGGEDRGSYSNSGSWIPPKMSDDAIDVNKFRPNLERDQFRKPSSMNVRSEIYASHVNMWRQMNLRYQLLQGTFIP